MKKEVSQNIFILPTVVCFVQFCFLFVALFNSGYYFANKVLIISFLMVLLWSGLFLYKTKEKNFYINIQNFILILLFIMITLYCIHLTWFSHYLSIGAIDDFFKGRSFIDVLYHSTLAQSIVTNGYPSVQQNAPVFLFYHSFSHYIIAFISILFSSPCFIVYNYIFPIIFIPLFLFLFQKCIIISRKFFDKSEQLRLIDYFLFSGVICSFTTKKALYNMGFFSYSSILSESCLVSLILLLLFFIIVDYGYKHYTKFSIFVYYLIIPVFLLSLLFTKISTGAIFCAGVCYYLFRKNKILSYHSLIIILYFSIFVIYYYFSGKFLSVLPATEIKENSFFSLFHYVLNYTKNPIYGALHYIFLFVPIFLIIYCNNSSQLFHWSRNCDDKINLFNELVIVLALASCAPGIFLKIDGGSAFYFCIPVYFFIWIMFLGTDTISQIEAVLNKKKYKAEVVFFNNKTTVGHISLLLFLIVFLLIPSNINKEAGNRKIYSMIKTTVASRIDPSHFRKEFKSKIVKLFEPVNLIKDKNYIIFNDIINRTKNSKADYCIFISDNSLINRYDYYTRGYLGRNRLLYGNLAITAYLGIPIINSLYIKNDIFYRGDKLKLGKHEDIAGYSMPPIICGDRVTDENMIEYAKKIGKKKIIILENNSYKIVDVK